MITDEQLNNLTGEKPSYEETMRRIFPQWNPSFTDGEKLLRAEWDTERIEQTKGYLHKILMQGATEPPSDEVISERLNDWWEAEGQALPRFVLDEIGIQGGSKVPTLQERLLQVAEDKRMRGEMKAKAVKEALGEKEFEPEDYLQDYMLVADPDDFYRPMPKDKTPIFEKLQSFDDDSIRAMGDIVRENPLELPPKIVDGINREIQVRDYKEKITDLIRDNPEAATAVLIGTQFFNSFAHNAPEWLSRKGIDPFESRPGEKSAMIEAARRIRTDLAAKNPTLINKISMNTGAIASEVIKFAALPNPGKLAVFKSLSAPVKAAIGIGSKSALIEALRFSEEGETVGERVEGVAVAGGTGAAVGYVFGLAQGVVDKIAQKIKVKATRDFLTNKASPEYQAYIKGLSEDQLRNLQAAVNDSAVLKAGKITTEEFLGRHESFLNALAKDASEFIANTRPATGGLSRAGMAEIGGEATKKVLKWATEQGIPQGATVGVVSEAITKSLSEGVSVPQDVLKWQEGITAGSEGEVLLAGVEAAKAMPKTADPVKPVIPTKFVSPEQAGPFKVTFGKTDDLPATKIITDYKTRQMVQSRENEITKLQTKLKQAQADKYVEIERAIAIEIAKKVDSLNAFKEKSAIKLVNTIQEAKAKITNIRNTAKFQQELVDDAISMVRAIPKEIRADFITRAGNVKTTEGLVKLADELDDGIAKYEKTEAIREIKDVVSDIEKKSRRGNVRLGYIPSPQREKLISLIDKIDLKKLSAPKERDLLSLQEYTKTLASELAGNLEALDDNVEAALLIPNQRVQQLRRLSQMNVNDMEAEDIRLVTQSLQALAHQAKLKSSLIQGQGYKPLDGALKDIQAEIVPTSYTKKQTAKNAPLKTKKGPVRATIDFADRMARLADMHLDTLVELSTGPGSERMKQVLDYDLHEGQRKSYEKADEWSTLTQKEFERIGFDNTDILDEEVTVTLAGKAIEVSKDFLIKLELHSRSPENLKSILKTQGWKIGDVKLNYPDDVDRLKELNDALQIVRNDPVLKGIADWTNKLNLMRQESLNETSMVLEGFQIARDPFYTSKPRSLPDQVEGTKQDFSVPPEQRGRYLPRTGGTQHMRLDRWSSDFLGGLESDAFYYGMAVPLRNARVIVNSEPFQKAMRDAGRQGELDTMITILRRTQGIATSKDMLDMFGSKVMRGFTAAALGFRVSTILIQSSAFPTALAETGWKYAKPMTPIGKKLIDRIEEDSPLLRLRWAGRKIGVEVGQSASKDAFELLFFGRAKGMANKSFTGMEFGDKQTIANIYDKIVTPEILGKARNGNNVDPFSWNGAVVEDLPPMNDVDSKAFRYAAARRTEYVVRRTQASYDILDRSVTLSEKSVYKRAMFMFRTELEAHENIVMRAVDAFNKSKKTSADYKKLAGSLGAVFTSSVSAAVTRKAFKWAVATGATAALAAFGIFKFNEPEEVDEVAKDLAWETAKNLISMNKMGKFAVTIGEQVADATVGDGYNWNRETFEQPILETLENGVAASVSVSRALYDTILLDEFVEESNSLDVKHNEQLADRIAKDITNAIKSSFNFGVRIVGVPLLAPTQEFLAPLLKESKIELIKEVTFADTDDPQAFSERVFGYHKLRKELAAKSKKERLTESEDIALISLNRAVDNFNNAAKSMREMPDVEDRKRMVEDIESSMDDLDYLLSELELND